MLNLIINRRRKDESKIRILAFLFAHEKFLALFRKTIYLLRIIELVKKEEIRKLFFDNCETNDLNIFVQILYSEKYIVNIYIYKLVDLGVLKVDLVYTLLYQL